MQPLQDYRVLLLALCLMKIVVRAFPTALRHATACTMVLFFLLHFPRSYLDVSSGGLGQQQGKRHTGSLTVSC